MRNWPCPVHFSLFTINPCFLGTRAKTFEEKKSLNLKKLTYRVAVVRNVAEKHGTKLKG